jgi:hypothetical protein
MRITGEASSKDMLEVCINAAGLGRRLDALEDKILNMQEKTNVLNSRTQRMTRQAAELFGRAGSNLY